MSPVPLEALKNLHRIGQLKPEPFDLQEFERLLQMARARLQDAQLPQLSAEGRFISAYGAAHAVALAALSTLIPDLLVAAENLVASK